VLPGLDEQAARALAIVALAGRSRADAAQELELDEERLSEALAQGRKSLRRSQLPLAGSGWCERAERLISDRIDGVLEQPGAARLDVHLRNCPRCVEHERRLVQATDYLTETFEQAHGAPAPAAESPATAPALAVVRPAAGPRSLPFGAPVSPPPPAAPELPPAATPPAPALEPEPSPEPASVPAPLRRPMPAVAPVVWGTLLVLAVLLVAASVALAVAGVLGASIP
jgi:hypothetical protein